MQQMFFPISRKIVVFRLFSFFVLFFFMFVVIESPHAQAEPTDANPMQNSDFESNSISFWEKWPSNAPGTIGVDARANKTPRGTLSAYIEPNNANVNTQMQQNLSVTAGKAYRLQVWVTTNGMTAYVEYWSNIGGNVVCGQTSVVYPSWSFISCNLTVPLGTTAFNVHIRGRAAVGKWMASDDWFLVDPTGGVPGYFHAQRVKIGAFKGVRATIKVPNPKLREAGHSFVSIRIIGGTQGLELGTDRENFFQQCVQKFLYAVQQDGTHIDSPLPDAGTKYIFTQGFRLVVISSGFARNLAGQNEISRSARNDKRKSCYHYTSL